MSTSSQTETPESRLGGFFSAYVASGRRRFAQHLLREPLPSLHAARAAQTLPEVVVAVGGSAEGRWFRSALGRSPVGLLSVRGVLELPATPEEVSLGSSKQTLRRKSRAAEKLGVTWRPVDDPAERESLMTLAHEYELAHAKAEYRVESDNRADFLPVPLWLAAYAADGRPVLLTVLPVQGDSALLAFFRVLEDSDESSTARYLMTRAAAEELVRRGVVRLIDGVHPANLSNGLRHFQRMTGFVLRRVRLK